MFVGVVVIEDGTNVGNEAYTTIENILLLSIALVDDSDPVTYHRDRANCRGFVYSEFPKNGGIGDNEGDGHLRKSEKNCEGGVSYIYSPVGFVTPRCSYLVPNS